MRNRWYRQLYRQGGSRLLSVVGVRLLPDT